MHGSVLMVKLAVNTKMDSKNSLRSMPLKFHTCDHIFVVKHFHSPPVKWTDRRDPEILYIRRIYKILCGNIIHLTI